MATEESESAGPRDTHVLIGHDTAERTLADALQSGRMPHAWIFAGPRGIGKATLAYRLTRHLLSRGEAEGEAGGGLFLLDAPVEPDSPLHVDPTSVASRQIAAGSHPNLLVVERGVDPRRGTQRGEIVVDDVRKVSQFLRMTASDGGWRVIIVDAADEMNRNAANALLKLLEEPPPRALLLLVAHAPGRLLPTIRSRCRVLRMTELSQTDLNEILRLRGIDLSGEEQAAVLEVAEGSVGRALWLLESGGLAVLSDLATLLEELTARDAIDPLRLHAACDAWTKPAAKGATIEPFAVARDLLLWVLSTAIRRVASGGEGRAETALPALRTAEKLVQERGPLEVAERLERVSNLLGRGEAVNQDRRQMLLDCFAILAR